MGFCRRILKTFIALDKLESESFVLPAQSVEEKAQLKNSVDEAFTSWLLFQQIQLLDKYFDNPLDHRLIFQSLTALWSTKPTDPWLIKRILELEAKYYAIAPRRSINSMPQIR